MTAQFVPDIEPFGIGSQQPFHAENEICFRCLDNQMKVVVHEAVGMDLPAGFFTNLPYGSEQTPAILIISENILTLVPAIHHMIDRPRIFNAQLSRPEGIKPERERIVNPEL